MGDTVISKKIALIGDPRVGKTSIQSRYLGKGFNKHYTPTLGANFSVKLYTKEDAKIQVIIVDMAGEDKFKPLRQKFFKGISGCLLVFDVTRPFDAEEQILPWVDEILEYTSNVGSPLAIIGNKIDLDFLRQIPMYEGMNAAVSTKHKTGQQKIEYFETSAKEGKGIDDAFSWLIEEVLDH